MLQWEHCFVCCWNLDTMENRSEVPQTFLNALLEKNGEDQLNRSFEELKYNSISVKKERNSLHTIKWRKNAWICHIVLRNCPLNTLLRERNKRWEDKEEEVGTYLLTGSTSSHSGEPNLEEAISDRQRKTLNWYYSVEVCRKIEATCRSVLSLILRRSRTGTVWFYTSTSNKSAARPKLYTKSLKRDLKRMYSRLTLVRISINL